MSALQNADLLDSFEPLESSDLRFLSPSSSFLGQGLGLALFRLPAIGPAADAVRGPPEDSSAPACPSRAVASGLATAALGDSPCAAGSPCDPHDASSVSSPERVLCVVLCFGEEAS